MRRAIDTAPKDGKLVILEDDGSGSFELARWSAEARAWVRENGELSKIAPTYWHRMLRDDYLPQEGVIPQKEPGSSGPSASPADSHPTRRDDYPPQEGDEFIPQKEIGSSHFVDGGYAQFASAVRLSLRGGDVQGDGTRAFEGHHRPDRDLAGRLFHAGQAAPHRPAAADVGIALRQVAKAVTVAQPETRAAAGKSERGPFARRWFAVSSIAAAVVAASLTGLYFHAEFAAYVTQYIGGQDNVGTGLAGLDAVKQETQVPSQDLQKADSLARDLALHQQADRASSQAARDNAEVEQGSGATQPETQQQPLEKEQRRAEALANELVRAQQVIATQAELAGKARDQAAQHKQAAEMATASLQQSLKTEHDRAEALTGELAKARRDLETQLALSSKEGGEAKKVAESAATELRLSLQKEHNRAEALASELATARTVIYAYEAQTRKASDQAADLKRAAESAELELRKPLQQEQERAARLEQALAAARRDVEVALSSKTRAENATAELRLSLQQERDRVQALAPGREPTQPKIGARIEGERGSNSQIAHVAQAAEAPATGQPAVAEAQGSWEAARLLARASALLGQGNIGSARIVLEHAVETGSARASFMLAETYDPLVLSKWKTYGTRGDVMKARELYAKALAGGIQEAKDRSVALR